MTPLIALVACIALVLYLFRCDAKWSDRSSWALWLPLIWMFFAASRFPSRWLFAFGVETPGGTQADGSPLDRAVFFLLIAAALMVLWTRALNFKGVISGNKWIWLYFAFGVLSLAWSVDPSASFRRIPKALGNVVMALVVLSEAQPPRAIAALLRRLAYLTLPMSIVFIHYYPDLGRAYNAAGFPQLTGVATQKNSLGILCLFAGIWCAWSLLHESNTPVRVMWAKIRVEWVLIPMVAYLLMLASSATSFLCLIIALGLLFFGGSAWIRTPRRIVAVTFVAAISVAVVEYAVGISGVIFEALGRERDLTTRVPMWQDILATAPGSPLLGAGFEAYWLTDAGAAIFDKWVVGTAHNSYLEIYISSGAVGLALTIASLGGAVLSVAREPAAAHANAMLRLCLIIVVILHSWTESAFRSVSAVWTMFLIAGMHNVMGRSGAVHQMPASHKPRRQSNRNTGGEVRTAFGGAVRHPKPARRLPGAASCKSVLTDRKS